MRPMACACSADGSRAAAETISMAATEWLKGRMAGFFLIIGTTTPFKTLFTQHLFPSRGAEKRISFALVAPTFTNAWLCLYRFVNTL